jgi:hypothetical protein
MLSENIALVNKIFVQYSNFLLVLASKVFWFRVPSGFMTKFLFVRRLLRVLKWGRLLFDEGRGLTDTGLRRLALKFFRYCERTFYCLLWA